MYRASLPAFNGPHLELIIKKLLDPFVEVFSYLVLFLQWLTLLALFPEHLFSVRFPCKLVNWKLLLHPVWTGKLPLLCLHCFLPTEKNTSGHQLTLNRLQHFFLSGDK